MPTEVKGDLANAAQVLQENREHWSIENSCHYIIDWNFEEDRSRNRTGYGPENMTRLRRFAIGVIKSKGVRSVDQIMRTPLQIVFWLLAAIDGHAKNFSIFLTLYKGQIPVFANMV